MAKAIISIEGNIGSGKSTLLSLLKEKWQSNKNIVFLLEPVEEWESIKDTDGLTMLQKFYGDQEKYAFPFQMMAYISRLALLKQAVLNNPDAIIISERSLLTDKCVFAKMLFDSDKMEDVNYQIYQKWFNVFANDFPITQIIYVNTDPEICAERITKRSRNGEGSIPLSYLEQCHKYHEDMIEECREVSKSSILELDGNANINDVQNTWIEQISAFI